MNDYVVLEAIERRKNATGRRAADDHSSDWVICTAWLGLGIITGVAATLFLILGH